TRRLDFLGAQAVPGHVDNIIHASQNPEIPVHGLHRSIRRKIWPILPFLALEVLAVLPVILADESVLISPNRLHDSRPGVADDNVPRLSGARGDYLSHFVQNRRENSRHSGTGTAGL